MKRRTSTPLALTCLAAALAQAGASGSVWAQSVRHLPQTEVQIKQTPQSQVTVQPSPSINPFPSAPVGSTERIAPRPTIPPVSPAVGANDHARGPTPHPLKMASTGVSERPLRLTLRSTLNRTASNPQQSSAPPIPPAWRDRLEQLLARSEAGDPPADLPDFVHDHRADILALQDSDLDQRLAWALFNTGQAQAAADWFRAALAAHGTNPDGLRYGLALTLRKQGDAAAALAAITDVDNADARALRGDLAVELALAAQQRGDYADEYHWLQQAQAAGRDDREIKTLLAWNALHRGDATDAARRFDSLYTAAPEQDVAQGLALALQQSDQDERLHMLARTLGGPLASVVARSDAQRDLDLGLPQAAAARVPNLNPALAGLLSPSVHVGGLVREKSGSRGTSQLSITRWPDLQIDWPMAADRLSLDVARVRLNAGAATPGVPFGSNLPGQPLPTTALGAGWEPRLSWTRQGRWGVQAMLGLTPSDGPVSSAPFGELAVSNTETDHMVTAKLYVEPVRDSMLSYVGLRDPASGRAWGRVLRWGGSVDGYTALGASGWTLGGRAALEHLNGRDVAGNAHQALALSLSHNLPIAGMRFFSIGPSLAYEHYTRNLSGFTWGHGGYFSPQRFITTGATVAFQTTEAKRWIAAGVMQMGWQSVLQDGGACFALTPPATGGSCTPLARSTSNGLGTSSHLRVGYLLSPHLEIDSEVGVRTGPAYRDRAIYLGLRYHFAPRSALFGMDLPYRLINAW